jgi:DNA helicase HerA-like ATPase
MAEEKDLFEEVFGGGKAKKPKDAEESPEKPVKVFGEPKKAKDAGKKAEKEEDEEQEEDSEEETEEEGEEGPEEEEEEIEPGKEEDEALEEEDKEEGEEPEEGKEEDSEEDAKKLEEKKAKKGKAKKKPKIKVVEPDKKPGLKEKIKKIVVAKAVKAAEKDEGPQDKEIGTKEVGVKEGESAEKEKPKDPFVKPELSFLRDDGSAFIGRKKSVFQKYGDEAALFIGRVAEKDLQDTNICLDSLNPHVVFVCGARGSGKSYVLGVIAEELAVKNKNVGVIVVDPVGVFWGMRYPNREKRELEALAKWEMLPQGLENLKVFIPEGVADQVPKSTYDETFSMPPSLLTTEDWCLTFGIERFSPSGLLMEKGIEKVKKGYTNKDGKKIKAEKNLFSLEDLIVCLQTDEELNSGERGYKPDSIRALVSRFDAAQNWGIFSEHGTPLAELSRESQMTVIDTSFLEDNVSALVIGILARRILAARKVSTRRESASRFGGKQSVDQLLEFGVPPTWLFIDEAHTLIPSGNTMTPASNSLIEYVKQGRQPGCSLVFATQQPSAINTKVLSQLDIVISHKLVFDDDVKAVYKRVPTLVPKDYRKSSFIKTLPVGVALTGDRREETTRAFVMKVRPRMSQHEGREAETVERDMKLDDEKVLVLATEMIKGKLERVGSLPSSTIDQAVQTLNAKYKSKVKLADVLSNLEEEGAVIDEEESTISIPGEVQEEALAEELVGEAEKEVEKEAKAVFPEETVQLLAFPARIDAEKAKALFNKGRKKRFLGVFGSEEALENIQLRHLPIYRVEFNAFDTKETFRKAEAYVNSITGEFIHFDSKKSQFVESKGLHLLNKVSKNELAVLAMLERKKEFAALVQESKQSNAVVKRLVESLEGKGLVRREKVNGVDFYTRQKQFELPMHPLHPLLASLNSLPTLNIEAMSLMREAVDKEALPKALQKLWKNVVVKKIELVYLPVYETFLRKKDGSVRKMFIEAVTGRAINLGKKAH